MDDCSGDSCGDDNCRLFKLNNSVNGIPVFMVL